MRKGIPLPAVTMTSGQQRERVKGATIIAVAGSLLLVALLQFGCNSEVTPSSQLSNANAVKQNPSERDLMKQVEAFASSDAMADAKASGDLERYDRQSLIRDLTRLYGTVANDDYHKVLIAFTFCKLNHEYALNKNVVLSSLVKKSPYKNFYGDWAVSLVHRLLVGGDKDVLRDLFAAAEWSDGAMSEELSSAYSDGIKNDPENFIRKLAAESEGIRRQVYVQLKDNSLTKDESERVKVFLRSVPPMSDLHRTAQETIKALQSEPNWHD